MATTTMPAPIKAAAKPTVTALISQWAAGVKFEDLSYDAIYQAKRFLLDSVGCALGGYQQHDVVIALEVLDEIAGPGRATVIGTGKQMDAVSASLANALMIRCMDYNDIYWKQDPSHPSDIFPAAMACCERAGGDGRELIVGLVLGHEFEMRLCEAAFPGVRERGWHHATLTAFVSPIVACRMLHLDWTKMQHAIGISASARATLGAVTAGKLTMMKNTADPLQRKAACLPHCWRRRATAGQSTFSTAKKGLVHCFGPEWKLNVLTDRTGGLLAHHTMWNEGVSHRSTDAHADLGGAGAGEGQRPEAGRRYQSAHPHNSTWGRHPQ